MDLIWQYQQQKNFIKKMTKYKKGEIVSYNSFDKIKYLKIETIIDNGEGNPYYEDIDGTGILESDIISNHAVFRLFYVFNTAKGHDIAIVNHVSLCRNYQSFQGYLHSYIVSCLLLSLPYGIL